ncbi:MAG: sigma-54-dependent Fis family transcriptional regulator [Deltaproteobacteria bacterium]|nr:sigma-54-dependent Fis family transcriptional regulator [Deltaproteobacteria bacterium]
MVGKKVMVVDDDESMRWVISKALEKEQYQVLTLDSAEAAMSRLNEESWPLLILDIRMPGMSGLEFLKKLQENGNPVLVIIMTAQATMNNAVDAMKWGAFDYLTKPFDMEELKVLVAKAFRILALNEEVKTLKGEILEKFEADTVVGESSVMQEIFKTIGRVAARDVTVLLTGESGTGKEVLARAIHYHSRRFGKPFVAVNLAAIPDDLMESELFGHEKGAFTGATARKIGKFEQANGGTLFLDEVGDLKMNLQTKLLRVLQEREVERVGGTGPIPVDVRILAATNSDLQKEVREGRFRDDLFFRLNVVPIRIPPLRERKEDIPLLLKFFLEKSRHELGTEVTGYTEATLDCLLQYFWPGNVRELENLVKRAVVMSRGPNLTSEYICTILQDGTTTEKAGKNNFDLLLRNNLAEFVQRMVLAGARDIRKLLLDRIEAPLIEMVMKEVGGNQIKAAYLLGINRNTLRKKIREYHIDPKSFRSIPK